MENSTIEMALLEPEERELVTFIYEAIPAEDRGTLSPDDILLVLDLMDGATAICTLGDERGETCHDGSAGPAYSGRRTAIRY